MEPSSPIKLPLKANKFAILPPNDTVKHLNKFMGTKRARKAIVDSDSGSDSDVEYN